MKKKLFLLVITSVFLSASCTTYGQAPNLNSAANFDLFTSVGAITNIGSTQFSGNIGTNSGTVTGFGILNTSIHILDSTTAACAIDLQNAYSQLMATLPTVTNHAPAFGHGEILTPGVYEVNAAISIGGTLTLNGQGNSSSVFIFKVGGAFTSGANSKIVLTNGAVASNVFWVAEGAISFATHVQAKGTFIAHAGAINFGALATLEGRALTLYGAINTYQNYLNIPVQEDIAPNLGPLSNFILYTSAGAVTNAGASILEGNIGTNQGAITGFPPSPYIHIEDATTAACAAQLPLIYGDLAARIPTNSTHAPAFGGGELIVPGVYSIGAAGSVAGNLILDGQGNPNAVFIIRIGGALTTAAGSQITLQNGATPSNIFWLAEGAISIAANTNLAGTFISHAGAISMGANCTLVGRALTISGAITGLNGMSIRLPLITTADQTICHGTAPENLSVVISGSAQVLKWQKATDSTFNTPTDIPNTTTTLTGSSIGILSETTWFRAVFQNENAAAAMISVGLATTWDGNSWDNGIPNEDTTAIFTGNFMSTTHLSACAVIIKNNAQVVINSGNNLTLQSSFNLTTGSNLTFNNKANLLQTSNVVNTNPITIKTHSSALQRLDYTLWSSPVKEQNILAFSPNTLTNRFYTYTSSLNIFQALPSPETTNFALAKGYLIRMPNTQPLTPTVWGGTFNGVPNNGTITYDLTGGGIFLVGNPYPSAINATVFMNENRTSITGTLYFWRKTNNALSPSYCTWTLAGFVGNGEAQVIDPNSIIGASQGFFVEALPNATAVTFNNTQRIGDNVGQFFRNSANREQHRVWINATNTSGAYSQMMIGYVSDATMGVDNGIDGRYNNDGVIALNSLIDAAPFTIQGRSLPFDAQDVIPLQFVASIAGEYTIAIDHVDGLFTGNQNIYLKDNLNSTVQDLKVGSYTFSTESGTFNNRFEIVYSNLLAIGNVSPFGNEVKAYKNNGNLIINSTLALESVKIYDISGRLLKVQKGINELEVSLTGLWSNGLLLVEITSESGSTCVKKIVW